MLIAGEDERGPWHIADQRSEGDCLRPKLAHRLRDNGDAETSGDEMHDRGYLGGRLSEAGVETGLAARLKDDVEQQRTDLPRKKQQRFIGQIGQSNRVGPGGGMISRKNGDHRLRMQGCHGEPMAILLRRTQKGSVD